MTLNTSRLTKVGAGEAYRKQWEEINLNIFDNKSLSDVLLRGLYWNTSGTLTWLSVLPVSVLPPGGGFSCRVPFGGLQARSDWDGAGQTEARIRPVSTGRKLKLFNQLYSSFNDANIDKLTVVLQPSVLVKFVLLQLMGTRKFNWHCL